MTKSIEARHPQYKHRRPRKGLRRRYDPFPAGATMPTFHLATFTADVTPPIRHPLCGGWIPEARAVDDPLFAHGVVLLGMGEPIVLCAVDWCGLRNHAHQAFRQALAKATHTPTANVAVQCVHPHNAPFADTEAERLIQQTPKPATSLDLKFFDRAVEKT